MRSVADALGVPAIDVLIAAGVVDPAEAKRKPVAPPADVSVDAAIENDTSLTDLQRRTLRDILRSLREVEGGRSSRARGRLHS